MDALARSPLGEDPVDSREAHLVTDVLRKDRKATAEFISRCSDWIYPFLCRRLLPRTDMVEDLMQETLISAWQSLPSFRGEAGLRPWILGIARHKVEDHYRKRIREAELLEDDSGTAEPAQPAHILENLQVAADEEQVEKTLASLPETYALALIWRYRDGKSLRDMAEATGKTEKAIERLLARARESFKKRWNHDQS